MTTTTTVTQLLSHTHTLSNSKPTRPFQHFEEVYANFFLIFFSSYNRQKRSKNAAHRQPAPAAPVLTPLSPSQHLLSTLHFPVKCCNNKQSIILIRNYISLFFSICQKVARKRKLPLAF